MKKILSALLFSLVASMISVAPAFAIDPPSGWTYPTPSAPTIISQSDPFCTEPDKRCDGVSVVINTPEIPDFDSRYMSALYLKVGTTGAMITNGQQGVVITGLAYGKAHTAVISYFTSEGPLWVTHYGLSTGFNTIPMTVSASSTPAPESSTAPSPTPTANSNSQITAGIWLISGRTSEIYGRGDGIADSQNQIQWVTCLESPSSPMLYPNRDNLNYVYTVTGPAGVVDTGEYKPTWIDSMSSCTGNNGGSQYTIAYNLTGLAAGTSYQFTVTGSNAGSSFTSSKSFTTMAAPTVSPTNPSTSVDTKTVTSETSTASVVAETSTSTVTPTPTPTPTPTAPAEPRGLGGYAVIHPDGYVCGVIVGNAYFGNNDRTMTSEYMGCPTGSAIIFQTKPSPTGNVAGWHGANVTYSNGIFTIKNGAQVAMTISDGIATDSTGRVWDTGSGETLRAAPVSTPTLPVLGDTATVTSAPSSGGSETATATAVIATETTTAVMPVAIPAADDDLSTLDEIFPEEEIIDSVDAVVQSNGTTRIEVSTGYSATAMRVVATKKGVKKRYIYRITTNSDGDRIFRASLNLRGYTLVLIKGSTELDRIIVS
jgi:hypothetical protein